MSLLGSRKRATADIDSSSDSSNDEDDDDAEARDELDSDEEDTGDHVDDDDDSDNEFSLASLTQRGDGGSSLLSGRSSSSKANQKKTTKVSSKAKGKAVKKRRTTTSIEVTLDTNSQLLSQVDDQDEGNSLYDQTLTVDADVEDMVATWVRSYKRNKIPALQALINYVIRVSLEEGRRDAIGYSGACVWNTDI